MMCQSAAAPSCCPLDDDKSRLPRNGTTTKVDDEKTASTTDDCSGSDNDSSKILHHQACLLRKFQKRDPMKFYEEIDVLGEGSMGRVSKCRKRRSVVGGSARPEYVLQQQQQNACGSGYCCLQLLSSLNPFLWKRHGKAPSKFVFTTASTPTTASFQISSGEQHSATSEANRCCYHRRNTTWSAISDLTTPLTNDGDDDDGGRRCSSPTSVVVAAGAAGAGADLHRGTSLSLSSTAGGGCVSRKEHLYALKSIRLDLCSTRKFIEELENEVDILKTLDHPNIVRAYETFEYHHKLYLVLELCTGGDLYSRDPYTEQEAGRIVTCILSAVSYLHSRGIVHGDLKYENCLFADNGGKTATVKLIDFGLSQKFTTANECLHEQVGTVYTMAPELLAGEYNEKADLWSVGVIAFMLLSSSTPFYGETKCDLMTRILQGRYYFSSSKWCTISRPAKRFVESLLQYNPDIRPTALQAMQLPWMKKEQQRQQELVAAPPRRKSDSYSSSSSAAAAAAAIRVPRDDNITLLPSRRRRDVVDFVLPAIQKFSSYCILKKLALRVIAYKCTSEEIGSLSEVFHFLDTNRDGKIDLEEFQSAFLVHEDLSRQEIRVMFRGMDAAGKGSVSYSEFLAATIEAVLAFLDEERIAEAFDRIDSDDTGFITDQNLIDLLLGEGDDHVVLPDKYSIHQIFPDDEADIIRRDHQRVDYDEFLSLFGTSYF